MFSFLKPIPPAWRLMGIASLILFALSSLRHYLLQSAAWDLGIFDQAVFLISQGQNPISSFLGFHILADHGAVILYPLALLYKIHPSVHWLLAVQAIALASGVIPVADLAQQAGLKPPLTRTMMAVYLLHPLVFNLNLFDFHPEVIALPALLSAILAARRGQMVWFSLAIGLVLSCKAVLGLTIAAMGVWLWAFEKNRRFGATALITGLAWFLIATRWLIPSFGGAAASLDRHLNRYASFGHSFSEIGLNLFLKPGLTLQQLITPDNLLYLLLLVLPFLWGLSWRQLAPLIGAVPQLLINLLADTTTQKNLVHHYSLPILPFFLVAIIGALADRQTWLRKRAWITLWALISFLALAKYGYFWSRYLDQMDTWYATRSAIAAIDSNRSVLTMAAAAPHLTHRSQIQMVQKNSDLKSLSQFEYILLNQRHPGEMSSVGTVKRLTQHLKQAPEFDLLYRQDDVYLFQHKVLLPKAKPRKLK